MRKTLEVLGLALIVGGTGASAHEGTITVGIDGFCNVEIITVNPRTDPYSIRETSDGCDENIGINGARMQVDRTRRVAAFSWKSAQMPGQLFDLVFRVPFRTGRKVMLYTSPDGRGQQQVFQATYTVLARTARQNPNGGTRPITVRH